MEAWFFLGVTTALVVVFVLRAGATQRWLREHPGSWARRTGAFDAWGRGAGPLAESKLWLFRILFGPIPVLMWLVCLAGLYCFFHGADSPPVSR